MTEHDNQHSANSGELVKLLSEVRQCFTRDDDLPGDLLSRIDAAIDGVPASDGKGFGAKTPIPSPMDYEGEG